MTYLELKQRIDLMTEEQLRMDVAAFFTDNQEFYIATSIKPITDSKFMESSDVFDNEQMLLTFGENL